MPDRDLMDQVFDQQSCALCANQGMGHVSATACVVMPWGTPTMVCEAHRALHAERASSWPAKDAILAMLRGES